MEHEFKGYALVLQDGADPHTTGGVAVAAAALGTGTANTGDVPGLVLGAVNNEGARGARERQRDQLV